MSKPTFRKSLLAISVICGITIGAFFTSAKDSSDNRRSHYNINYNDSTYNSKYILTPISATDLTTSEGSNYYIIVSAEETLSSLDESNNITVANALCTYPASKNNITGYDFVFKFTEESSKSIDIRDLGADVGGMIFAYCNENIGHEEPSGSETVTVYDTYYPLFSLANVSYLDMSNMSSDGPYTTEVDQANSWNLTSYTDSNNVDYFTFQENNNGNYLCCSGGTYLLDSSSTDRNLYLYSVSESLVRELSYTVCASYIYDVSVTNPTNATYDNFRTLFCNLPCFERDKFAYGGIPSPSSTASTSTFYYNFATKVNLGLSKYIDVCGYDFHAPSVDTSSLTVSYDYGYITGFSPFEYYLSVATDTTIADNEGQQEYVSHPEILGYSIYHLPTEQKDRNTEYNYSAHYKTQKFYLVEQAGLNLYGETVHFRYGQMDDYECNYASDTAGTKTISANPAAGDNIELEIATTEFQGSTTQCIFDGEIQLKQVGDEGDYEYALVSSSLSESWSAYYMNANLEVMKEKEVWQTSSTFTTCYSEEGFVPIEEEMFMVAYIRKASTGSESNPSPVIDILEDIGSSNLVDGYILRMRVLNEDYYEEYQTEHEETYNTLSSDTHFESFNLDLVYNEAEGAIVDITEDTLDTAKVANTYTNPTKLEMAYDVYTYLHDQIADSNNGLMDAYTENQTTKAAEINADLINDLKDFRVDFSSNTENEMARIDEIIAGGKAKLELSESIDVICRDFIAAFNNYLAANPQYRTQLWAAFPNWFDSIHNAETLEDAQAAYSSAIAQIKQIVGETTNG